MSQRTWLLGAAPHQCECRQARHELPAWVGH
jgi:hypothetical protein